jgi:hypothetical protein
MKSASRPWIRQIPFVLIALCRTIIATAFWIATRLSFRVEIRGLEHDKGEPGTYFGMAHKRDLDPIVLIPSIIFHRGWLGRDKALHFALRGDGFSTGYLARIVMQPRWISRFLRLLSIGTVLRWLGTHPTESLLRPTEEWIRELLDVIGDVPAGEVLAPKILYEIAGATAESCQQIADHPLSHLLSWRYHAALQCFYGSEILLGPARRLIERRLVSRIKQQLADLSAWLQSGGSLLGSPEGQLSPDGKLRSVNPALHRILRNAPGDTRIIPIYLTYDYMTTRRRISIFIDIAPAIEHAPMLATEDFDAQLRLAWLHSARFTCTQLASGFILEARRAPIRSFTLDELTLAIHRQAVTLAEHGRHIDRQLLQPGHTRKLAKGFLAYAERHALVRRLDHCKWIPTATEVPIKVRPMEVAYDTAPLLYSWNELQELLSDP